MHEVCKKYTEKKKNNVNFVRQSFVLYCSDHFFYIYLCLFHAANIKEKNIIDSHAVWTEVNVVTSLQIKERKTHLNLKS